MSSTPCATSLSLSPWTLLSPAAPADKTFHDDVLDAVYKSPAPKENARASSLISVVDSMSQTSQENLVPQTFDLAVHAQGNRAADEDRAPLASLSQTLLPDASPKVIVQQIESSCKSELLFCPQLAVQT